MESKKGLKYDGGKPMMNLLPFDALEEVAKIMTFGASKYEENGWKTVPNGQERYLAAMLRHITKYKNGEVLDEESGLNHIAHMACNALFILHLELQKNK